MKFEPTNLDFERSPYTGLTRENWMEAGIYLLKGIFENLDSIDAPMIAKRTETEVTYPHLWASKEQQEREWKAEIFEGLTRTFFIGSVLIHNEPDLKIGGILLRDYYKKHILRIVTPSDPVYVGSYEQMQSMCDTYDPFHIFQQTVETCALVIGLWACKEQIWDTYSKEEKDLIADFLTDWAVSPTVPQNWRLFNMLDLAFLSMNGYEIDEAIMLEHAQAVLDLSVGDGWYRDGHSFDYYSCWAFNMYGPLWCLWYGYEHAPELAALFEKHSNELMKTYPEFFDEDGWTNMWGRSCIYRNAATSPFDGNMFLRESKADPGRARRIASGSLLQFLQRDDFMAGDVPSLGFYGQFTPLVQGYSCAESPYWMGKAFLCLHLPKDHPFWTAKESNGIWENMAPGELHETVLNGPGLAYTNHKASGETILRSGKVRKMPKDRHGMWNYGKLCYNTKYPWEAGFLDEMESQQYVTVNEVEGAVYANQIYWCGEKDGVLYRKAFLGARQEEEDHWIEEIRLADFAVPYGIIRADKLRMVRRPCTVTLGSYGFPDNGTQITAKRLYADGSVKEITLSGDVATLQGEGAAERGNISGSQDVGVAERGDVSGLQSVGALAIIVKGHDHTGSEKQMAMTVYQGWDSIRIVQSSGTNPDSEHSVILCAQMAYRRLYDASEPHVLISQVITKEDLTDFADDELFPIEKIEYADRYESGAYGPVALCMKNGTNRTIDYSEMEAHEEL